MTLNAFPKILGVLGMLMLFPAILTGCANKPSEITGQRFIMHTYIEIKIIDDNALEAQKDMEEAFQIFRDYESKYNFHDPGSLLNKINGSDKPVHNIPPELYRMLDLSYVVSEKSSGAFNINVGPLIRLWNFGARNPEIPEAKKIQELLPQVNAPSFSLRNGMLYKKPGACLDLSGVVKGFAVDAACDYLISRGISRAMVNAGGNIRTIGRSIRGEPWKIGIVDPRSTGRILGQIRLEGDGVATSGDYFRFFMKDGIRYHHLLDPHTGYPSSGCISVTVVAKSAGVADVLSTAAFVLGPEKGKKLLREMGCEGIFITDSKIDVTSGLAGNIKIDTGKYRYKPDPQ
jgi:FAD:protein FMN transferase